MKALVYNGVKFCCVNRTKTNGQSGAKLKAVDGRINLLEVIIVHNHQQTAVPEVEEHHVSTNLTTEFDITFCKDVLYLQ